MDIQSGEDWWVFSSIYTHKIYFDLISCLKRVSPIFNGTPLRENFIFLFKKLTADAEFENAFVHNFENPLKAFR